MFPLRDVIPSRTTPWVTFLLIAVNLVVFLFETSLTEREAVQFVFAYGLVPARLLGRLRDVDVPPRRLAAYHRQPVVVGSSATT
jgi:membrane associated rhomboid family serine protease